MGMAALSGFSKIVTCWPPDIRLTTSALSFSYSTPPLISFRGTKSVADSA